MELLSLKYCFSAVKTLYSNQVINSTVYLKCYIKGVYVWCESGEGVDLLF